MCCCRASSGSGAAVTALKILSARGDPHGRCVLPECRGNCVDRRIHADARGHPESGMPASITFSAAARYISSRTGGVESTSPILSNP